MSKDTMYTIGHSDREREPFLALLEEAGIGALADVRTYPSSRRFPWFNEGNLVESLEERGIRYRHLAQLGGLRDEPDPDPAIEGVAEKWQPYAAHVQTEEFSEGLESLVAFDEAEGSVAFMCAERDPDRCHRQFIADALTLLREREVVHLIRSGEFRHHEVCGQAEVEDDGRLTYPADQRELPLS